MHEVSKNPDRKQAQNVAICMNTWREAHGSAEQGTLTLFATQIGRINAAKGVIYGVSVITEGEVKGHDMWADAKTLKSVLASAQSYEGGLKVKLDHGDSIGSIIGTLQNFRIDGSQLRADLYLLKNSEHYDYVLELASSIPEQVGMSIAFSYETDDPDDDDLPMPMVRCLEIYSCDLVDSPAANAGGLFSKQMSENATNPEIKAAAGDEPALESRLAALEAALAALNAKFTDNAALATQLSALEIVVNGFTKAVDEQKTDFERKLSAQATEFQAQLKDADILASRKLAATGVAYGKAPPAEAGNIVDLQAHMMSLKDPRDQLEFYNKNKDKIHAQFGKRK